MEQVLTEIVGTYDDINFELLNQHTDWLTSSDKDKIVWDRVEHLHVFGKQSGRHLDTVKSKPGFYVSRDGTWVLAYRNSVKQMMGVLSGFGESIVWLNVQNTYLSELDVSAMTKLRYLAFKDYGRPTPCSVDGIDKCRELMWLDLIGAAPKPKLDVSGLDQLKKLRIMPFCRRAAEPCMVTGFQELSTLENLCLGGIWNQATLDVSRLSALRGLFLPDNKALRHVEGLANLQNLEVLSFAGAGIRELPEDLRQLKNLERLDLQDITLDALPDWLDELGLEFSLEWKSTGILLENTNVEGMDMSIFSQPQEMILQWFEERKKGNEVPLNEIKVVFLGDGEAGKSHTIARLLNDGGDPLDYTDQATPGVVIKNKKYELDGRKIKVHFWDFGGQEILHSMHRMFLTERTLYVVLVNARDETQDARARYWLHNIRSFAKNAPVLLVLNKMDQNPNADVNERELRSKYSGLKKVVKMSALKDSREEFNEKLRDVMLEAIRETGNLDIRWPTPWTQVKAQLEKMETNYIDGSQYQQICLACNVNSSQKDLLHWFNDLGVSFCCCDDYKLEDYVILRPDWITNAIYIILFNECEGAKNGLIPHRSIRKLLDPTPENRDSIRRVLPNVVYKWSEIQYVLNVVRKFQLSFEGKNDHEFIPMLCQRDSMPAAETFEQDPNTLEFQMEFEYLPNNVLHRLMVERQDELSIENVWLTGALFEQQATCLSAVVTIDGNLLRIFVRSNDPMHRPNTYLSMIKANVDNICQKMNLQEPRNSMVYKLNGQQERFDYELLTAMLEAGQSQVFSMKWRRMMPIWDIMNQAAPAAAPDQKKLLGNLVTACQQLQANERYWKFDENQRNTVVRDVLRLKGYVVHDQSLQGISGGENKAGELDLDIRRYENVPWTVCEALRIADGAKTSWNSHLKKLLDNYNPHGAQFLFLLTYVDCEKEKFGGIWDGFQKHIQKHNTGLFTYLPQSWECIADDQWAGNHYIKIAKCQYACGDYMPTVYHIFVRMGR